MGFAEFGFGIGVDGVAEELQANGEDFAGFVEHGGAAAEFFVEEVVPAADFDVALVEDAAAGPEVGEVPFEVGIPDGFVEAIA